MSYQKTTGPLMANSHPNSKKTNIWAMTTEKNSVITLNITPALRSRDYKDPPVVLTKRHN